MVEVIAELCQNHNGDFKLVEEMVYAAAESGATYAKIQSMLSSDLTHRPRFDEGLVEGGVTKVIKRPYQPEYERLSKLDLNDDQHYRFLEICQKANIKPMTTVFSRSRVPFVTSLKMDTIKVASFDCSSYPLLKDLVKARVPRVIVSTGVTFDEEIAEACRILRDTNFSVLHCISIYPLPIEEAHLNRIDFLKTLSKSVGLSDHSNPEVHGSKVVAVGLTKGIDVIEKHFTILPKDKSRDGPVSANPKQLKEIVELSRLSPSEISAYVKENVPEAGKMLGDAGRKLSQTELLNRDYYRGRFASRKLNGEWLYNWEEGQV